jgi:hypothetical protein
MANPHAARSRSEADRGQLQGRVRRRTTVPLGDAGARVRLKPFAPRFIGTNDGFGPVRAEVLRHCLGRRDPRQGAWPVPDGARRARTRGSRCFGAFGGGSARTNKAVCLGNFGGAGAIEDGPSLRLDWAPAPRWRSAPSPPFDSDAAVTPA